MVPAQDMKAHRGSRAKSPLTFTLVSWQLDAPAASLPARQPKYALEVKADWKKRKIPCMYLAGIETQIVQAVHMH